MRSPSPSRNHRPRRAAHTAPPLEAFTPAERALIARLTTPARVQAWLNALPYNAESHGATQRSFRGVVRTGRAHCMEAALSAATILEQHGYPPLVMSLASIDLLDHVIFIYRAPTGWGSVARSRDPGLHGRRPVFASPRALARSYIDPYVDYTGRLQGFGVANLVEEMGSYDWRLSVRNVWKVEQMLIDLPHRRMVMPEARYQRLKARYAAYLARYGRKPLYYEHRHTWTPLPAEFRRRAGRG